MCKNQLCTPTVPCGDAQAPLLVRHGEPASQSGGRTQDISSFRLLAKQVCGQFQTKPRIPDVLLEVAEYRVPRSRTLPVVIGWHVTGKGAKTTTKLA